MLSFLGKEPHNFDMKSRIFVEFQHPLRWRRHSGHSLDKNADWLPDFDVVGIHGERTGDDYETYTVAVGIKRDPTNINGNVVASSKRFIHSSLLSEIPIQPACTRAHAQTNTHVSSSYMAVVPNSLQFAHPNLPRVVADSTQWP